MGAIVYCLLGYCIGLVLAQYVSLPPPSGVILGAVLLFSLFFTRHQLRTVLVTLLLFCLLTGLIRYPVSLAPPPCAQELDLLLERGVVRFEGIVLATQEKTGEEAALDVLVMSADAGDGVPLGRDCRLRLIIAEIERLPPIGSRIVFRSRVRKTRNFGIPGEFDFTRYLAYQRIWHTAYLSDSRGLAVFAERQNGVRSLIGGLRQSGMSRISQELPEESAPLVKALLLGDKGEISQEVRAQLAAGGVSHLFAISGLHLGLLAFLCYGALRFCYSRSLRLLLWQPPSRVLWLPILPLLFVYLLLTGDALATRRAFYALLVIAALLLLRRRTEPLWLLMSLAFVFLLIEPLALWQPSFLLSFSGALGILLWHKPLLRLVQPCSQLVRYPLQLFGLSLAAFIATLPATVYFFHLFAPAGLICNLFAIPLVSFVALPLGLAGLVLGAVWPPAGALLLQASAWGLQRVLDFAVWVASFPLFEAQTLFLTLAEMLAVLLVCLALLVGWQKRWVFLLCLPAPALFFHIPAPATGPEFFMFSVGQGESMLLRVDGKTLLVDAGGLRSDSFDVGERLLAPALGRLGVKQLDAVVLTHNHPDHGGGLNFILNNFRTPEVWTSAEFDELPADLQATLQEKGVAYHRVSRGWEIPQVAGLDTLSLFVASGVRGSENDRSVCLYLPSSAGGLLLTGDLEARGVRALMQSRMPGQVGLLKAPHHGSAGSEPQALLAFLQPQLVVVSAGYGNSYRFPAQQLLEQADKLGADLRRTDQDGTLQLSVVDSRWKVRKWERGLFR